MSIKVIKADKYQKKIKQTHCNPFYVIFFIYLSLLKIRFLILTQFKISNKWIPWYQKKDVLYEKFNHYI